MDGGAVDGTRGYLFPRGFGIPGTQHIVDGAFKGAFEPLDWWAEFVGRTKVVAQWLHVVTHRRFLQGLLPAGDPLRLKLNHGCESFAKWRWHTLGKVTDDLLYLKDAVERAVGFLRPGRDLDKEGRQRWE